MEAPFKRIRRPLKATSRTINIGRWAKDNPVLRRVRLVEQPRKAA
jgi:hypothetical protein